MVDGSLAKLAAEHKEPLHVEALSPLAGDVGRVCRWVAHQAPHRLRATESVRLVILVRPVLSDEEGGRDIEVVVVQYVVVLGHLEKIQV